MSVWINKWTDAVDGQPGNIMHSPTLTGGQNPNGTQNPRR